MGKMKDVKPIRMHKLFVWLEARDAELLRQEGMFRLYDVETEPARGLKLRRQVVVVVYSSGWEMFLTPQTTSIDETLEFFDNFLDGIGE